jgi:uncharacterized protein
MPSRRNRILACLIGTLCLSAPAAALALDQAPAVAGEAGWRQVVRQFAREHFKNPAWGYSHCVRDYELARDMAAADHVGLDDDVLFAAAYLHDIAAFKPWADDKRDHSDVGAEAIDVVLKDSGFPATKLGAVRAAIRTHMYYRDPVAPEALYLHDADALDWLGAIGIARVIALSDPDGGHPTAPETIKRIEANLDKVPARVLSPAGRARVPARMAETKAFLGQLRQESDELDAL